MNLLIAENSLVETYFEVVPRLATKACDIKHVHCSRDKRQEKPNAWKKPFQYHVTHLKIFPTKNIKWRRTLQSRLANNRSQTELGFVFHIQNHPVCTQLIHVNTPYEKDRARSQCLVILHVRFSDYRVFGLVRRATLTSDLLTCMQSQLEWPCSPQ